MCLSCNDIKKKHLKDYPKALAIWDYSLNKGIDPTYLSYGSCKKKYWWKCDKGHSWESSVNSRIKGCKCTVCANRTILIGVNDLASQYPDIAKDWDIGKNELGPDEVTTGYGTNVFWKCHKCNHEWKCDVYSRTKDKRECTACKETLKTQNSIESKEIGVKIEKKFYSKKRISGVNDIKTKCPDLEKEWDYEKNLDIDIGNTFPNDSIDVWWKCENGHSWKNKIKYRSHQKTKCPYCLNLKVLKGYNDLASQFPNIALEWDNCKNNKRTDEVTYTYQMEKYWWGALHQEYQVLSVKKP